MRILIGVTGSVAAIKVPELIHQLTIIGHECRVIITKSGLNFVTPCAIASMGATVFLEQNFTQNAVMNYSEAMQHIILAKWAECILIVPLTANTLAKIVTGITDNLLLQVVLASTAKVILIPAMNQCMWKNSVTQQNIAIAKQHGYIFWGPVFGVQACKDNDIGRMLSIYDIMKRFYFINFTLKKLSNKTVVITLGATREAIDAARCLTNYSSGKMGCELAYAALSLGMKVKLVCANVTQIIPETFEQIVYVDTTAQMLTQALELSANADFFIGVAAVSDYRFEQIIKKKLDTKLDTLNITFIKNPDVIATVKQKYPNLFVVGFAAQTHNLIKLATQKLIKKKLDMIVINDISNNIFGQDMNQVTILDKNNLCIESEKLAKAEIAKIIWQQINDSYN